MLFEFHSGLALVSMNDARLWTDGRYFLQAEQELSDQWKLMRIGEDPPVDAWMADVSYLLFVASENGLFLSLFFFFLYIFLRIKFSIIYIHIYIPCAFSVD